MTFSLEWKPNRVPQMTHKDVSHIYFGIWYLSYCHSYQNWRNVFKMLLCQHSNDYLILRNKITLCNGLFLCVSSGHFVRCLHSSNIPQGWGFEDFTVLLGTWTEHGWQLTATEEPHVCFGLFQASLLLIPQVTIPLFWTRRSHKVISLWRH